MRKLKLLKKTKLRGLLLLLFQGVASTITSISFHNNVIANAAQHPVLANNVSQKAVSTVDINQSAKADNFSLLRGNSRNFPLKAPTLVAAGLPVVPEWDVINKIDSTIFTRLANNNQPDASGAMGSNKQGYMSVVFQRNAIYPTTEGLLNSNSQHTANSIHGLEYAFDHQSSDGSFQTNSTNAKPGDVASAASFFYSELGHSLLLAQNSNWFQTSTQAADLRTRLDAVKNKAGSSLNWLISQTSTLSSYDGADTNRLFFDANAYYLTARALGRSDASQGGRDFVQKALNNQLSAGYFLEKGGYDSSYQGVSLLRAIIFYMNLEDSDTSLRQNLWSAIVAGVNWELTRVLPTGEVSTDGNTRVFPGGEQFLGQEKQVAYADLALALNYYSQISGDQTVKTVADNVSAHYAQAH